MSTREKALRAAVELLGNQGLRALTHLRVDDAAGLPKGSTSNHFRTRAALLKGVVEWIVEREMPGEGEESPSLPTTADELAAMLAALIELQTGPDRVVTTARYVLFLEGTHDDAVRQPLLAGRAAFRGLAESLLGALGAADPAAAATAVMAVGEGLIMHRLAVEPDAEVFPALRTVVRAVLGDPDGLSGTATPATIPA